MYLAVGVASTLQKIVIMSLPSVDQLVLGQGHLHACYSFHVNHLATVAFIQPSGSPALAISCYANNVTDNGYNSEDVVETNLSIWDWKNTGNVTDHPPKIRQKLAIFFPLFQFDSGENTSASAIKIDASNELKFSGSNPDVSYAILSHR